MPKGGKSLGLTISVVINIVLLVLVSVICALYFVKANKYEAVFINSAEMKALMSDVKAGKLDADEFQSKFLGIDTETGLPVEARYFCSDVCPEYGYVDIYFAGIRTKEECAKIKGEDVIDFAWGGYVGCKPKVAE